VSWTPSPDEAPGSLFGVHGTATDDVWVVGLTGRVRHWDGTSWSTMSLGGTTARLTHVWAVARDQAWASGEVVARWNGTLWSVVSDIPIPPDSSESSWTIWAADARHAWASSENLYAWNGSAWRRVALGPYAGCGDLIGVGPDEFWCLGGEGLAEWNGGGWTRVPAGPVALDESGLGGNSRAELWAVGSNGTILRRRE
jgi:hypothetical protein